MPAGLGVVFGLALAVALGYGIYRGGVRLNLSRFFRVTGAVLVLVAAGLVASSLHTAAEAGWVVGGQSEALDLSAVIRPGTVWESLITGILGIHAQPTVIEVVGWLLYAIPMLAIVLVPDAVRPRVRASRGRSRRRGRPGRPARGHARREQGDLARRWPAAAAAGGRSTWRSPTRAAQPATLKLASGTDHLRRHQQGRLAGRPSTRSSRAAGPWPRSRTSTDGLTKRFSLTLQPGRYTLRCTGAEHEEGCADGDRRARQPGARPGAAARRRRLPRLPRARDRRAGDGRRGRCGPRWPAATSPRPGARTRRRACPTSASSPSPRASATSTRASTPAPTTSRSRSGRAFTRSSASCGCRTRRRAPRSWPTAS